MRDDVKDLFTVLLEHLDSKKTLLNSLLENEISASDLIKNRNDAEDDILKIIEEQTSLIEDIDVVDYSIAIVKDEITRRYNFDFNKIFRKNFMTAEPEIMNFRKEVLNHHEIISRIVTLKKENYYLLNKSQEDLGVQISELERIGKIKIVFPKDLQSS